MIIFSQNITSNAKETVIRDTPTHKGICDHCKLPVGPQITGGFQQRQNEGRFLLFG